MKAIHTTCTMGAITSKKDRSLGFRLNTPELSPEEKAAFMELQSEVLEVFIKPLDIPQAPELVIDKEVEFKSHSERLRNTIYALWSTKKEQGDYVDEDFQQYYAKIMESMIDKVKQQLEELN